MILKVKKYLNARGVEMHGIVTCLIIVGLLLVRITTENRDARGASLGLIPFLLVFVAVYRAIFPKKAAQ